MKDIADLSRAELLDLLRDMAVRWLAHDGLWFQAVERRHGLAHAIELDTEAWEQFTVLEARRIKRLLDLPEGGGIAALAQALRFRLYALVNEQEAEVEEATGALLFRMRRCRVQEARERKGMAPFPCKPVGLVEYGGFARTIDPRLETEVLVCPPDPHPPEFFCAWRFSLPGAPGSAPTGA